MLVVAPLSGHFKQPLRETVKTLLADHDVCITDWHNRRDIPVSAGVFSLKDYIDHKISGCALLGPDPAFAGRMPTLVGASLAAVAGVAQARAAGEAQHDAHGRAGQHPRQPHQGERARVKPARSNGSRKT